MFAASLAEDALAAFAAAIAAPPSALKAFTRLSRAAEYSLLRRKLR
jgi:hypothetical protein